MSSTAKRFQELKETDLDLEDGIDLDLSKLRPPGDLRMWAFGLGVAALALGAIGVYKTPYSYDHIVYSEDWVNVQLDDLLPAGLVEMAVADFSSDLPKISAVVTDGDRRLNVMVSGHLKLDSQEWSIRITEPKTKTSDVYRGQMSASDVAATFVPEIDGHINDGWSGTKKAASVAESGIKWITGAVASVASGDFIANTQFPGQAKNAVWDMPLADIPDSDRSFLSKGSISSVDMIDGKIVVNVEFWNLNFLAMVSFVLMAFGASLLGALFYSPAFLSE